MRTALRIRLRCLVYRVQVSKEGAKTVELLKNVGALIISVRIGEMHAIISPRVNNTDYL